MVSIDAALARIKREWVTLLDVEHIEAVCRAVGLKWRRRVLDPVTTTLVFFLQILHRNTAMTNLPRLAGRRFTAGAYCQARKRLPLEVLQRLLRESGTPLRACAGSTASTWRGRRIFLLDGSSCSMPDTRSLQRRYGQPGGQAQGCGFPVAHLLLLVEADTGLILDVHVAPLRTHDLRAVTELHPYLQAGDILLGDRGFCSYGHVAELWRRGVWAVFRLHQRLQLDAAKSTLEQLIRFSPRDVLVLWRKPGTCPQTMRPADYAALPEALIVRLVEYHIRRAGYRTRHVRLLTTLLDPQQHSAQALSELYGLRWQIETDFRHLKLTLGLDVLHGQTPDIVEKEIAMFALVYNLVRRLMLAEAQRRGVAPERVSFIDALRQLAWPLLGGDPPLLINPLRPGRFQPRVRKRRPKEYPVMKEPRNVLKRRLLSKRVA